MQPLSLIQSYNPQELTSIQELIPYSNIKLFEDIYHLLQSHKMMMDLFFLEH